VKDSRSVFVNKHKAGEGGTGKQGENAGGDSINVPPENKKGGDFDAASKAECHQAALLFDAPV